MDSNSTTTESKLLRMIELKVAGKTFKHFSSVDISLGIDTIASTFSFNGYFNVDDQELKKIFKPF